MIKAHYYLGVESLWLEEMARLPPDDEVVPGVTMGDMLALHSRPPDPPGAVFRHGVEYARVGDRSLTLALYGRADAAERAPAVVFVHGGGWHGGDPYMHIRHAHGLAERGYVSVVISYRLGTEAPWPAALEDVKAAVRWVRETADETGADPERIAVAGGSAGGHLSALVALDEDTSTKVQAAVLWYPATDLTGMDGADEGLRETVESYFGGRMAEVSPINHVRPGAPPILSITGSIDGLTTVAMVRQFHEKLDAAGVPNRLAVFEGRDHAFDLFPADWQESFDLLASFLDDTLHPAV